MSKIYHVQQTDGSCSMTALTGVGNTGLEAGAHPFCFWLQGGAKFACAVKLLTVVSATCCLFTSIKKEDTRHVFSVRTDD